VTPLIVARIDVSDPLGHALDAVGAAAGDADGWWHRRADLLPHLPAEALSDLVRSVRGQLAGSGAVLVRLGPSMPADSTRLLQLLLGEALGPILTIAPDEPGRPLFRLSAVEGAGRTGAYVGNAKKRTAIGFHTDGSGVSPAVGMLSMACIRPALRGGETRLCDSRTVHQQLSDPARRVLELPQPRENPYRRLPSAELVLLPVFDSLEGQAFSYHPSRVRNGIMVTRGGLSDSERAAFEELDKRLAAEGIELLLVGGDIIMIDNRRVAHDRGPFEDDEEAPRLLERLWIGVPVR